MRFHGREIEKVEKASSAAERERQRKENDSGKTKMRGRELSSKEARMTKPV